MKYPRLEINLPKLDHNARILLEQCRRNDISDCFVVTKVLSGFLPVIERLAEAGFSHLADSRLENLIRFRNLRIPKVLLRLPMASEADRVVRYADISLNSELPTMECLERAAGKTGRVHGILLMFDLGDLREGLFFRDDYLPIVEKVLQFPHLKLVGIGTNLTCYGGVIPDASNLGMLMDIKNRIETTFGIRLPIVSGGNSSTVHLFDQGIIPSGINSLRIGEALFLGRETAYGNLIPGMNPDVFVLRAEIIEAKQKPSYPIGNVGMNSFGDCPDIEDRGSMHRAILAIGRQDVEADDLRPLDPGIRIIGASSDHLIVDLGNRAHQPGDILEFGVNYPGLLRLMTSPYVRKVCISK
jgi:predicted amino acid racemase